MALLVANTGLTQEAQAATDCSGLNSADDYKKRYPVQTTDELLIVYLDGCALTPIWKAGRYKQYDFSLWRPSDPALQAFAGFKYPGDMPISADQGSDYRINTPDKYDKYATFLVKKNPAYSGEPIKPPVSYSYVWEDRRSGGEPGPGGTEEKTFFELNCDDGYVALGLRALDGYVRDHDQTHEVPEGASTPVYCFDRNLTVPMQPLTDKSRDQQSDALWSTAGIDNHPDDLGIFGIEGSQKAASRPNTILIAPPTFWSKRDSREAPSLDKFRGLALPLKAEEVYPQSLTPPKLDTDNVDGFKDTNDVTESQHLSAFLVKDSDYYATDLAKFSQSPVYYVKSKTTWVPVGDGATCTKNTGVTGCTLTYNKTRNTAYSDSWNSTSGVNVSLSATVEVGVAPLGVGGKASVTMGIEYSYAHEHGGSVTKSTEEGTALQTTLTAPVYAHYFQASTEYSVYRRNDTLENHDNQVRQFTVTNGPIAYATHALTGEPGDKTDASCAGDGVGRDLEKCGLPTKTFPALEPFKPIYSADEGFYLFLSSGGQLEVRSADTGVEQDADVWSLDQNHLHGTLGHAITSVAFSDGQLVVNAVGLEPWTSTAKPYPGASLEIDASGNLRIVQQVKGHAQVIWNSKFDTGAKK